MGARLAYAHQYFHGELVELFVGLTLAGDGGAIKGVIAERRGFFGAKAPLPGRQSGRNAIDLAYQGLRCARTAGADG